jgi:hypothetical protein
MKYLLTIFIAFNFLACSNDSCLEGEEPHSIGDITLILPTCFDVYIPDSNSISTYWITRENKAKLNLRLGSFIQQDELNSYFPERKYNLHHDTLQERYLVTIGVRRNYKDQYKEELDRKQPYELENQPFWFSIEDIHDSSYTDTMLVKMSDGAYLPITNNHSSGILRGLTNHPYMIFRPSPEDIEYFTKMTRRIKIK